MAAFGLELSSEFSKASSGITAGEVKLFRALQNSFRALGRTFHVEEYHGTRHLVRFSPTQAWRLGAGHCELADLLLISYQRIPFVDVRFTFLQCKQDERVVFHSPPVGLSFAGNYEQWDLLCHRPLVTPSKALAIPPDVLRTAMLASVGSFGIFHRNGSRWDMAYCTADALSPATGRVSRNGPLFLSGGASGRIVAGSRETIHTCCLETFGRGLECFTIGTPAFASPYLTRQWLADVLRLASAESPGTSAAREVADVISQQAELTNDGATAPAAFPHLVVAVIENGAVVRRAGTAG